MTKVSKSRPVGEPVQLGDRVRDMVTGIEGIATSRTEWLNACVRIGIEYKSAAKGEDASKVQRETFDEEQLEVVHANAVVPRHVQARASADSIGGGSVKWRRTGGGGRPEPQRHP